MIYLIPIYMALTSGWSGGSLWPSQYLPAKLTWVPEAFFALGIGYALYPLIGGYAVIAVIWSYAWQQSGTAPMLHWGTAAYNPARKSTLKPFVDAISPWHPSTVQYCRLYAAVKGLLITLPVGGLGIIGYPLAYELGYRAGHHAVSECGAGFSAGLSIVIFITLLGVL